jgi:hypothetical protein
MEQWTGTYTWPLASVQLSAPSLTSQDLSAECLIPPLTFLLWPWLTVLAFNPFRAVPASCAADCGGAAESGGGMDGIVGDGGNIILTLACGKRWLLTFRASGITTEVSACLAMRLCAILR